MYFPILHALREQLQVVAVCDRAAELCAVGAREFGVPGFGSLRQLVRSQLMEAAIVVTPPNSHHAVGCFLSTNGVHHLIETPICDTLRQAQEMVSRAQENGVVFRVGEQFFRDPFDVLSREIIARGVLGKVGRITNYQTHLGYHNNSRHQVFAAALGAQSTPLAVNALAHEMPVAPYVNTARHYSSETFHNISFHFNNGLLITDISGNVKGALGRYARPGLIEIDGERGAIVQQANAHWQGRAEVRLVADDDLQNGNGAYSQPFPIRQRFKDSQNHERESTEYSKALFLTGDESYVGTFVALPEGEIWARNEFLECGLKTLYHAEVAGAVRDFCDLIRTGAPDFFPPDMAVTSLRMERAAQLSCLREGARVLLDDPAIEETDAPRLRELRTQLGIDPLDVEAMIDYSFPAP